MQPKELSLVFENLCTNEIFLSNSFADLHCIVLHWYEVNLLTINKTSKKANSVIVHQEQSYSFSDKHDNASVASLDE